MVEDQRIAILTCGASLLKEDYTAIYLNYDEGPGIKEECDEVAEYLTQRGIAFTKIPQNGTWQPHLHVGVHRFEGVDRIKAGIERLLREGKLETKVESKE